MAILISKVVKSGSTSRKDGLQGSSSHKTDLNHGISRVVISGGHTTRDRPRTFLDTSQEDVEGRGGSSGSEIPLAMGTGEQGIMKTVETSVVVDEREDAQTREL